MLYVLAVYCVYVRINLAHFMQRLGNVVHKLWRENVAQHNSRATRECTLKIHIQMALLCTWQKVEHEMYAKLSGYFFFLI